MKQPMRFPDAVRTCSLAMAATVIFLAAVLMVPQAQASRPLANSGVTLVSLGVGNPQPYLARDWGDEAGNKTGRSAVFPPVQQQITPGQSGQLNNPAPATVVPLHRETVLSEPLNCHPGCKLA